MASFVDATKAENSTKENSIFGVGDCLFIGGGWLVVLNCMVSFGI